MTLSATDLLDNLERRGVRLAVDDAGRLVYRAPKGALTDELRAALVERKLELVRALRAPANAEESPFNGPVLAALVCSAPLGGPVWLIADPEVFETLSTPHQTPWFLFAEVEKLRRRPLTDLRVLAADRRAKSARLH